jgi:hypothetical protein
MKSVFADRASRTNQRILMPFMDMNNRRPCETEPNNTKAGRTSLFSSSYLAEDSLATVIIVVVIILVRKARVNARCSDTLLYPYVSAIRHVVVLDTLQLDFSYKLYSSSPLTTVKFP